MHLLGDVLEWDVATWSRALAFWSREADLSSTELQCLEIGARAGGLSLWLASAGHRVICSDLRGTERAAGPLLARHGVAERVRFQDIDATTIPYQDHFDVIVFKSVLGGIGVGDRQDRQAAAVNSMYEALKPGGRLLFAENLTGSPLHRYLRRRFVRWGESWRYVTIDEMRDLLRQFREVRYDTTGVLSALGRSEGQRRALSALDRIAFNALLPRSWHYVMYGVALK